MSDTIIPFTNTEQKWTAFKTEFRERYIDPSSLPTGPRERTVEETRVDAVFDGLRNIVTFAADLEDHPIEEHANALGLWHSLSIDLHVRNGTKDCFPQDAMSHQSKPSKPQSSLPAVEILGEPRSPESFHHGDYAMTDVDHFERQLEGSRWFQSLREMETEDEAALSRQRVPETHESLRRLRTELSEHYYSARDGFDWAERLPRVLHLTRDLVNKIEELTGQDIPRGGSQIPPDPDRL